MWLALLGMHLVGLVGFNLVLRHSVLQKVDRYTLSLVMQTGISIPAILLIFLFPPEFNKFSFNSYLFLIFVIVLNIALHLSNVKTLQYLEASVYSILYNLRIIITTALGILFLNEDVVWLRIAGGAFIFLAIIIVKQKSSKHTRLHGILWGVITATILSFLNMFEKLLVLDVGFINYFPLTAIISGILMWGYFMLKHKKLDRKILLQTNMRKLMILRAMSAYGFSGALGAGALISVGNYISGMSVIFTVIFGALILKETDYMKRKIAAALVAVVGLTFVLLSTLI